MIEVHTTDDLSTLRRLIADDEIRRALGDDATPENPDLKTFVPEGSRVYEVTVDGAAWTALYADRPTTTAMNAAIAAAIGGVSFNAYVGVATLNAAQSIPVDATPHKMTLDTVQINGSGAIVLATSRYVAPAPGVYQVVCNPQFDNDTGVAATMEVLTSLYKNGVIATEGIGGLDGTPSPTGGRWNGGFTGLIQLATNDFIEVWATLQDGTNTGAVDLTTWDFSVHRVSS